MINWKNPNLGELRERIAINRTIGTGITVSPAWLEGVLRDHEAMEAMRRYGVYAIPVGSSLQIEKWRGRLSNGSDLPSAFMPKTGFSFYDPSDAILAARDAEKDGGGA